MSGARRVGTPVPAAVRADPHGLPLAVSDARVDAVREEWVVEDLWWAGKPLRRRYFELVLADGRDVVVFCEPAPAGRWFLQRA